MGEMFWAQGHLTWPFFAVIVFSLLLVLTADIVWRLIQLSAKTLAAGALLVWVAGLAVILVL